MKLFPGMKKFETRDELPDEYRDLLVYLLTVQADTEFASVQQLRPWLDTGPTVEDRWITSRILMEEMRHGWQMCQLLEALEAHDKVEELLNTAEGEHKLDSFNMPFERWSDQIAYNCLVDRVGIYQLKEFDDCSFGPLARAVPQMLTEEQLHIGYGHNRLRRLAREDPAEAQASVDKWFPRALDMFGKSKSYRNEQAIEWRIKKHPNEEARQEYLKEVRPLLTGMGLTVPDEKANRRFL